METEYASVGNKTALLETVLDIAVVGDDAQIALDDRPWFGVGECPLAPRVAALAEVIAGIYRRTAELRGVLDSAARNNAELAELDARSRAQERISRTALVSAAATAAEWRHWYLEYNVKPLGPIDLSMWFDRVVWPAGRSVTGGRRPRRRWRRAGSAATCRVR